MQASTAELVAAFHRRPWPRRSAGPAQPLTLCARRRQRQPAVNATSLAGMTSSIGKTGSLIPTATLSGWLVSGSGIVLSEGIPLSESPS